MKKEVILDLIKNLNIDDFEISKETINNIKYHPLFVGLELTNREIQTNIVYLNKVISEDDECKKCKGFCPFNNYHLRVKRLNGKIYFYNDVCLKTKDALVKNMYKSLFLYNYYKNDKHKDVMFDENFVKDNGGYLKKAKYDCISKFISIMDQNSNHGLYIYGKPNVGKTYLTIAMANTVASKYKKTVSIIYMPEFVERINSKIDSKPNDNSSDEFFEAIKNSDVLFFDDLGAEYASEWFYCNHFLNLINFRSSTQKLTFFNSNLSIHEYSKRIQSKIKSSDSKLIADRIVQRINNLVNNNFFVINSK